MPSKDDAEAGLKGAAAETSQRKSLPSQPSVTAPDVTAKCCWTMLATVAWSIPGQPSVIAPYVTAPCVTAPYVTAPYVTAAGCQTTKRGRAVGTYSVTSHM